MKVYRDINLVDFGAWSGAEYTKTEIIKAGKADDFDAMIDELYPDGLSETMLNDILWFDRENLFDMLLHDNPDE